MTTRFGLSYFIRPSSGQKSLKRNYTKYMNFSIKIKTCLATTSLVVWWSELLATNHEVPGSIPRSTMGIFLVGGGSPW